MLGWLVHLKFGWKRCRGEYIWRVMCLSCNFRFPHSHRQLHLVNWTCSESEMRSEFFEFATALMPPCGFRALFTRCQSSSCVNLSSPFAFRFSLFVSFVMARALCACVRLLRSCTVRMNEISIQAISLHTRTPYTFIHYHIPICWHHIPATMWRAACVCRTRRAISLTTTPGTIKYAFAFTEFTMRRGILFSLLCQRRPPRDRETKCVRTCEYVSGSCIRADALVCVCVCAGECVRAFITARWNAMQCGPNKEIYRKL